MNKSQAGRMGGLATVKKHGREHMQRIGALGATATHTRYRIKPYNLTDFVLVDRQTGAIACTRTLHGNPIPATTQQTNHEPRTPEG